MLAFLYAAACSSEVRLSCEPRAVSVEPKAPNVPMEATLTGREEEGVVGASLDAA
jgi:hypothetical protein